MTISKVSVSSQIPLKLMIGEWETLENFITLGSGNNEHILNVFINMITAANKGFDFIYLAGPKGSGKTHLLKGISREMLQQGRKVSYCSLKDEHSYNLKQVTLNDMICVDDIDVVADFGKSEEIELSLFELYNTARLQEKVLIFSAVDVAGKLNFALPDLISRLQSALLLVLEQSCDRLKVNILKKWALNKGIYLDDKVIDYFLLRSERDMHQLIKYLNSFDYESLKLGKKVTIPLIKQMLKW